MKTIPSNQNNGSNGLFIFVGQAGCQTGSSLWQLFNMEHSIQPDGFGFSEDACKGDHICFYKDSLYYKEDQYHRNFCYYEVEKSGKYVPRTVFLDLEPSVMDEIKNGAYRHLFSEDWSFHEYSKVGDGAGIFSRAYNTIGRCIITNVMNTVRHIAEKSDKLNVINMARSYGGATGSGLGSLLLEKLRDGYTKILLSEVNILNDSGGLNPTLEPYNTLFGIESSCSSGGITFLYNNSALKNICYNKLRIKKPLFYHLNELLCHGISSLYSSERFPGYGSCNMNSIFTNLIPYPRIQFAVCGMAPIIPKGIIKYEPYYKPVDMISDLLSSRNTMFDINFSTGSFISCCNIYRGIVSPFDICSSNHQLLDAEKIKMVEWNPRGIKNGHSPLSIVELPDFNLGMGELHMVMLSNHTNISDSLSKECLDVHIMLKKKAFLHWFLEHGMEIDDFKSALENAMLLSLDYKEIDISPDYGLKLAKVESNSKLDVNQKLYIKQRIQKENLDLLLSSYNVKENDNPDESTMSKVELLEQSLKEEQFENIKNILGSLTEEERHNIISIAKSKGFDSDFLKKLGEGNISYSDLDMLQTLTLLMDEKENDTEMSEMSLSKQRELTAKSISEVINNMSAKDKDTLKSISKSLGISTAGLLESIANGDITDENLEIFKVLMELKDKEDIVKELSEMITSKKGDKEGFISLAKSLGINDEDFFDGIRNGKIDIDDINTLKLITELLKKSVQGANIYDQTLLGTENKLLFEEIIEPQSTEMYGSSPNKFGYKYENAIETIESFSKDLYTVKVNTNQVLCALSTRRSYEESYVSCICPKTSLTKVYEFQKHQAKLKVELSKSCHDENILEMILK